MDLQSLCMCPIERGSVMGPVGNGKAQLMARELLSSWSAEEEMAQWHSQMGTRYVAAMMKLRPAYFRCKQCNVWL
jgi:hypothetical protein